METGGIRFVESHKESYKKALELISGENSPVFEPWSLCGWSHRQLNSVPVK